MLRADIPSLHCSHDCGKMKSSPTQFDSPVGLIVCNCSRQSLIGHIDLLVLQNSAFVMFIR
jgi:hypothetical protein